MTELEIYHACHEITADLNRRGIKHVMCCALIRAWTKPEKAAAVYISMTNAPKEFDVESPTFAESFRILRENIANHIPDEERLAAVLGYTEVRVGL